MEIEYFGMNTIEEEHELKLWEVEHEHSNAIKMEEDQKLNDHMDEIVRHDMLIADDYINAERAKESMMRYVEHHDEEFVEDLLHSLDVEACLQFYAMELDDEPDYLENHLDTFLKMEQEMDEEKKKKEEIELNKWVNYQQRGDIRFKDDVRRFYMRLQNELADDQYRDYVIDGHVQEEIRFPQKKILHRHNNELLMESMRNDILILEIEIERYEEMKAYHEMSLQSCRDDAAYIRRKFNQCDMEKYKISREVNQKKKKIESLENEIESLENQINNWKNNFGTNYRNANLETLQKQHVKILELLAKNSKALDEHRENERICDICMDEKKSHIIYPCGHPYCLTCINKVSNCPFCKKQKQGITRILS